MGIFLAVFIALCVGGILTWYLLPNGPVTTAGAQGQRWFAWMATVSTMMFLPSLLYLPFRIDTLAKWIIIGFGLYGGLAFAVGWTYGKFRFRGQSAVEQQSVKSEGKGAKKVAEIDAPNTPPVEATEHASPVQTEEALWALALAEFEGQNRRMGLWAKTLAQAHGNESLAKAAYLNIRYEDLKKEAVATTLVGKGLCPNCDEILPLSSQKCPKCAADFGAGSAWRVRPSEA